MNLKVLENSGTVITSTEGVTMNTTFTNAKNGIVRGRLGNFTLTNTTSQLNVASGHLIINGVNVILEENTSFSVSATEQPTVYYLIVDITASNEQITATLDIATTYDQGSLNLTGASMSGELKYAVGVLTTNNTGIVGDAVRLIDYLDTFRLYEHNIVCSDEANPVNAYDIVAFSILSSDPTPFDNTSDVSELLYERGFGGISSFMKATGRSSTDSFQYAKDIDFGTQETDYGCCESVVIGVYGNSASELKLVVSRLDEDDTPRLETEEAGSNYFHDNVVLIF